LSATLLRTSPSQARNSVPLCPIENAAANVAGPANGFRGGSRLTHSSRRTLIGAGIVTDTIRLSYCLSGIKSRSKNVAEKTRT